MGVPSGLIASGFTDLLSEARYTVVGVIGGGCVCVHPKTQSPARDPSSTLCLTFGT